MSSGRGKAAGLLTLASESAEHESGEVVLPPDHFLLRIMAEREATGKRRIRPKQVSDEFYAEDSDDPDFEMNSSGSAKSGSGSDSSNSDDSDSDSDAGSNSDDDGDSSKDGSVSSSSDEDSVTDLTAKGNNSQLRAAVKKMNEESVEFAIPKKKPRKTKPRKPKPESDGTQLGVTKTKSATKAKVTTKNKTLPPPSTNGKKKSKKKKVKKQKRKNGVNRNTNYDSITSLVTEVASNTVDIRNDLDWFDPICAACLSSKKDPTNDIFECDSCRITVHEGCYVFDDNLSVSSRTDSSSSTEPWFCDGCRNNLTTLSCELCPNIGGLLKETTDGRFVHLVCSIYIPEIVTYDGKPNISVLPYSKYGRRACDICEDERFAHTGICITCDAALCRFATHPTCAQKDGLLAIPRGANSSFAQAADPYFACCKAHSNIDMVKIRALNYKRLQEQIRIKKSQKSDQNLTEAEKLTQSEVRLKLEKIRRKTEMRSREKLLYSSPLNSGVGVNLRLNSLDGSHPCTSKSLLLPHINLVSPRAAGVTAFPEFKRKKRSRLLYTSAFAMTGFHTKVDRMGLDLKRLEIQEKEERLVATINKKYNIHPALNVEFAAYYCDRERRIESMSIQCEKLGKENIKLNETQEILNSRLEDEACDHMEAVEESNQINSEIVHLKTILQMLAPENKRINNIREAVPYKFKNITRRNSSPIHSKSSKSRNSPTRSRGKKEAKNHNTGSSSPPGRLALFLCAICKKGDSQHLITRCDHCRQHFHLGCLDPPLTRMPKRSRLCGWMCSDCGDLDVAVPEEKVDTEAPRELRGRTKIKRPAKYTEIEDSDIDDEGNKTDKVSSPGVVPSVHPAASSLLDVRVKMEALPALTNGNARSSNRANSLDRWSPNSSDSIEVIEAENQPLKPKRVRKPQNPRPRKEKTPRRKTEKPEESLRSKKDLCSTKKELSFNKKEPSLTRGRNSSGLSKSDAPGVTPPVKRARKGSVISPNLIVQVDLETLESPGASGLTAAEKSKVDARSSFSLNNLKGNKIMLPATSPSVSTANWINNTQTGIADSLSPKNAEQSKPAKKPRKQKITPKNNSPFWTEAADLVICTIPPSSNPVDYSTVIGDNSCGRCDTCGKPDSMKNLVSCENCKQEFHFYCLIPPLKYSPKRRGYSWFCANCDETSSVEIEVSPKTAQ